MELWVRSQDRLSLEKVDLIVVNGSDVFSQDAIIGTYDTCERALEVLDEIQSILRPKGIIKFNGFISQETAKEIKRKYDNQYLIFSENMELLQQVETYVYEMPQE